MELFSIGVKDAVSEFRYKLNLLGEKLQGKGYSIQLDEIQRGDTCFLTYQIPKESLSVALCSTLRKKMQNSITEILLDFFIRCEGKKIVRQLVSEKFHYFEEKEQKKLQDYAMKLLLNDEYMKEYRAYMREELDAYLKFSPEIIVEGFIRFRLKAYRNFLEEVVEEAAENYMNEVEYQEFIQVLKYFVSMNTAQVGVVQILFAEERPPSLLDDKGEVLSYRCIDFVERKSKEEYEELLTSTLINLAPNKIILHRPEVHLNEGFIETLHFIFPGRIGICGGCDLCGNQ